jgi:hypothetical protein
MEGLMQCDLAAESHSAAIPSIFARAHQANGSRGNSATALPLSPADLQVPYYLNAHYWWAYIHPRAVQLFERQWLVNLILWGNYARLRDAVLDEMGDSLPGARCRSHAYTAYWSQLPSQDNVLRRPLPESGDHTLNQQRYRLSFTRTLVASGPVSPTSSL